jgi:hypothetical protein
MMPNNPSGNLPSAGNNSAQPPAPQGGPVPAPAPQGGPRLYNRHTFMQVLDAQGNVIPPVAYTNVPGETNQPYASSLADALHTKQARGESSLSRFNLGPSELSFIEGYLRDKDPARYNIVFGDSDRYGSSVNFDGLRNNATLRDGIRNLP